MCLYQFAQLLPHLGASGRPTIHEVTNQASAPYEAHSGRIVGIRKLARIVGRRRFVWGMVVGCRVRVQAGVPAKWGQSRRNA